MALRRLFSARRAGAGPSADADDQLAAEPGGAVPVEPDNRGSEDPAPDELADRAGREDWRQPVPPVGDRPRSWELEEGDPLTAGRTVVRTLGGGTRYEVFLVWDDYRFTLMVAKAVRPDQAEDPRALRDLRKEAEALERLAHPVVIRGFDVVLEGRRPHLLIEHLEGPTLRRLIRRHGALPMEQLLPLALHVAAAIHYMAAEEMVHLDVKPDNIVMGIPPRLIDLSIARSFERARRIRGSIGTDAYMPPEQCRPEEYPEQVGPAADVWGLGATLYHSVAGRVPFPRPREARDSEDPLVRFPQLVERPQALPPPVPKPLEELIMSTLRRRPEERPAAVDVAMGLEPLVSALPRKVFFARGGTRYR